jgi:hypothetical protein
MFSLSLLYPHRRSDSRGAAWKRSREDDHGTEPPLKKKKAISSYRKAQLAVNKKRYREKQRARAAAQLAESESAEQLAESASAEQLAESASAEQPESESEQPESKKSG